VGSVDFVAIPGCLTIARRIGAWPRGVALVLYYSCPPLVRANEIVRHGFPVGELVAVSDRLPKGKKPNARSVVFLGVSYDFPYGRFPLRDTGEPTPHRLIPGHVLNVLPRAIWP
jgi:hypothetical protein